MEKRAMPETSSTEKEALPLVLVFALEELGKRLDRIEERLKVIEERLDGVYGHSIVRPD